MGGAVRRSGTALEGLRGSSPVGWCMGATRSGGRGRRWRACGARHPSDRAWGCTRSGRSEGSGLSRDGRAGASSGAGVGWASGLAPVRWSWATAAPGQALGPAGLSPVGSCVGRTRSGGRRASGASAGPIVRGARHRRSAVAMGPRGGHRSDRTWGVTAALGGRCGARHPVGSCMGGHGPAVGARREPCVGTVGGLGATRGVYPWSVSANRVPGPDGAAQSHARRAFAERLGRRPLLLDGATGTLLFSRGVPQRASLDELVETRPELVSAVHREYISAGADIIETDTFGANRIRLAPHGLADRTARLNRRAAQLAREARDVVGRDVLVAGSVGPVGSPIHAPGRPAERDVRAAYREQIEGLLEGGVDVLMLETVSELADLLIGIEEARSLSDLPVVASMTFGDDLAAMDGTTPGQAAAALLRAGVDAFGVNCGVGPVACLDALEQMPGALLIMPNAGLSSRVEGQFVYAAGPAYLAEAVPRFLAAGARLLGGCCGTTPEHIAAMRQALDREFARAGGATVSGHGHGRAARPRSSGTATARTARPRSAARPRSRPPPRRPTRRHPRRPASPASWPRVASSSASRSTRPGRSASSAPSRRRVSSRTPASTSSTSATAPWRGCAWVPWRWPSASSTTWTLSAWSTSPPATAT